MYLASVLGRMIMACHDLNYSSVLPHPKARCTPTLTRVGGQLLPRTRKVFRQLSRLSLHLADANVRIIYRIPSSVLTIQRFANFGFRTQSILPNRTKCVPAFLTNSAAFLITCPQTSQLQSIRGWQCFQHSSATAYLHFSMPRSFNAHYLGKFSNFQGRNQQ